jgi:hypothetical protein
VAPFEAGLRGAEDILSALDAKMTQVAGGRLQ